MAQRKTVTVFFSDVVGSTSLGESVDPEVLRGVMERYFHDVRAVLERHGGTLEKFIGDAVVALFGIPVTREDDALRALRASAEIRERQDALNDELERAHGVRIEVRTGVNTGEVAVGDSVDGFRAAGDTMNTAARLEQAAAAGEILIGALTRELGGDAIEVEPVEPLDLKGKAGGVEAFRLVRVLPDASPYARREDAPLVGRRVELDVLRAALDRAVTTARCELVTIVGPAGVGKTRLARETLATLGDGFRVLAGRCVAYGEGITFLPIAQALRQALGDEGPALEIDEAVSERIQALVRGEEAGSTDEMFWAIRRFLEALAGKRPLVLVVDDIHWAEATLLDLLEYLATFTAGAPMALVATSRPELLEERPTWSSPRENATVIVLEPLSEAEAAELAESLGGGLGEQEVRRLVRAADGNPLFLEQLLALNADGTGDELVVPATIQALLAARIDQLPDGERRVLEHASIEGREFHRRAVVELLPEETRASAGAHLLALARSNFVRAARSSGPDDAFAFVHGLMRDAAYQSIPKNTRAELHVRLADHLEHGPESAGEPVGLHLAEAVRYRRELGRDDELTRDLARRASERLVAAGRRALAVGDDRAAAKLLERVTELVGSEDDVGRGARFELGRALAGAGRLEAAGATFAAVGASARSAGDRSLELRSDLALANLQAQTDVTVTMAELSSRAERALSELEQLGDERGLALTWWLLHWTRFRAGRYVESAEAAEQAVVHAARAGDRREELRALGAIAMAAKWGPTPADEILRICDEIVERADGARLVEAFADRIRGVAYAMFGEFQRGREACDAAVAIYEELGLPVSAIGVASERERVERLAGDLDAAERVLRDASKRLREIGDLGYLSWIDSTLARALALDGRADEAVATARASRSEMQPDHAHGQFVARIAEAIALSSEGMYSGAEEIVAEALLIADATDSIEAQAEARSVLASIHAALGRHESAQARLAEAIELYERKGNIVSAARLHELAASRSRDP